MLPTRVRPILLPVLITSILAGCISISSSGPPPQTILGRNVVWTFDTGEQVITSPVADDSNVYVRTNMSIIAVDKKTGSMIWRADSPGRTGFTIEPMLTNGVLLVPETEGPLAAFEASTGNLLWRICRQTDCKPAYWSEINAMAVTDTSLYVARYDWDLTAYDVSSGKVIWSSDIPGRTDVNLAGDGEEVYLSADGMITSFESDTGNQTWERAFGDNSGSIVSNEDAVYFIISDSQSNTMVVAVARSSKALLWETQLPNPSGLVENNRLTLAEDFVYVAGKALSTVSNHNGTIFWTSKAAGEPSSGPVIVGAKAYYQTRVGNVQVFDLATGHILYTAKASRLFTGGYTVEFGPTITGDLLIMAFNKTYVVAIKP